MHDDEPLTAWLFPTGHSWHEVDVLVDAMYLPTSQSLQKWLRIVFWYFPGVQGRQKAEPVESWW